MKNNKSSPAPKPPAPKLALLGAGGKMGVRLAANLAKSRFHVAHVELSESGRQRLQEAVGVACVEEAEALARADLVVLAVPDRLIGTIAQSIIGRLKSGAAVIVLDAAAPHAGKMPRRGDVTYFVTHPCHPPLFGDETGPAALQDHFGGIKAPQAIVCALMQGPESHYPLCEEVARILFAPVFRAHRCTVDNLAVLEPAMSETVAGTLCMALRAATEEAIRRGVPREAAFDFMLGHLNIELTIAFEVTPGARFSDGALQAIAAAEPVIFRQGWLGRVFDPKAIKASTAAICAPPKTG
jgi:hypothetical protein